MSNIEIERHDECALVRIRLGSRKNALRPEDASELANAAESLAGSCDVAVFTGEEGAFSAGADLHAIMELLAGGRDAVKDGIYEHYQRMIRAIHGFPGVSIAAVDGPALGLGADIALACDHRIVGSQGWLMQGWSRLAVIPGTGGAWLANRAGGASFAWEFLLSNERWSGDMLERAGVASSVEGSATEHAMAVAARLSGMGAEVVAAYKTLNASAHDDSFDDHLDRCLEYQSDFIVRDEFSERALRVLARP